MFWVFFAQGEFPRRRQVSAARAHLPVSLLHAFHKHSQWSNMKDGLFPVCAAALCRRGTLTQYQEVGFLSLQQRVLWCVSVRVRGLCFDVGGKLPLQQVHFPRWNRTVCHCAVPQVCFVVVRPPPPPSSSSSSPSPSTGRHLRSPLTRAVTQENVAARTL